jgi:hypothetical protein
MSNGTGVRAPLTEVALRNEGEAGKGTEVGEGEQEDNSNLGDDGKGGSDRRYAEISWGISRSGVTGRLIGSVD